MSRIAIITDFGLRGSHYVAEMKGVALNIFPSAQFIDISHSITPFSIIEAAYVLHTTVPYLPNDTIIVCVVDPGVGSNRDIVAVQLKDGHIIVGPDNGIFSFFVDDGLIDFAIKITEKEYYEPQYRKRLEETSEIEEFNNVLKTNYNNAKKITMNDIASYSEDQNTLAAFERDGADFDFSNDQEGDLSDLSSLHLSEIPNLSNITDPTKMPDLNLSISNNSDFSNRMKYYAQSELGKYDGKYDIDFEGDGIETEIRLKKMTLPQTFHGRDIMMPVAAHLANGLDLFALGDLKEDLIVLHDLQPQYIQDKNKIRAKIQYIDAFGNAITTIKTEDFQYFIHRKMPSMNFYYQEIKHSIKFATAFSGNDKNTLLLLPGSSGYLEICQNQASASENLNLKVGDIIEIELELDGFEALFKEAFEK